MDKRRVWVRPLVGLGCLLAAAGFVKIVAGVAAPDRVRPKDDPKGATAYRLRRMQDERRQFDPNDLVRAIEQKKAMATNPRVFGGGGGVRPANGNLNPGAWEEIGPGNIGGRMRSILIDPSNANIIYLGAVSGGVWKTTTGGTDWTPLEDQMANLGISHMARDPGSMNILYAGTGEAFRGAGIFKSTDGGVNWSQLPGTANANYHYVRRLAVSPSNGQLILAATATGLYRSTNGGNSWGNTPEVTATDNPEIKSLAFHPTNGQKAVAGSGWTCQAFHTNDGGDTWSTATGLPTDANGEGWCRVELAYARSNPSIVYALVDRNDGEIYKSTNGGSSYARVGTWTHLHGGLGFHASVIWVDPLNPNNLIVGGVTLSRSTDGGLSFVGVGGGIHADQHIIVEHPQFASNHLVFIGNDGGIYRVKDDFSEWTELNNNLRITQFFAAAANPVNNFIAGGTQDNGTPAYFGDAEGWRDVFCCDGGYVGAHPFLDPDGASYFYVNMQGFGGGPLRVKLSATGASQDSTWFSTPADDGNFIPPMLLDPNDPGRLYKGGTALWLTRNPRTTSGGAPMVSVKPAPALNPEDPGGRNISAIAVAPGNSSIIWVGHNSGDVYVTQNGTAAAPSWQRKDTGSPALPDRVCNSVAVDPFNSNRVYAAFGGFSGDNLWRSDNGGTSWTNIGGSLPDVPIYVVTVNPYRSNRVYVGTEIGVFGSDDSGASWSPSNEGPTTAPVEDLFWMQGRLVSATHGRSMFRITIDVPASATLTAPADGSHFQPGSLVSLAATATDANGSVSKVQFLDGNTVLGEDTSSPYTFDWTNVPAGPHVIRARAHDNDGNITDSTAVTIRSLPVDWVSGDVGAVGVAGSANYNAGTFSVRGSGTDIWGSADAMHFAYQPLTGNGQIVARVASVQNTNGFAKAGVMIRESLAANAKNALAAITPANGFTFQTRTATGGTTTSSRTAGIVAPQWVRLVRNGNSFSAFRSADGTTWTQQGSPVTISMASTVLVGLAVTAHNNTVLNASGLTNVTVTPGNPAALLVVGSTTLNPGDSAIRNRLQGLGYTVTVKAAASALSDDSIGKALVYISSTGSSGATAGKFTYADAGVISNEAFIYDDMNLTGPTADVDYGNLSGQNQLAIVGSSHPLAGGLSGTVTFAPAAGTINFGVPPVNAVRVAAVVSNPNRAAVFGYEKVIGLQGGSSSAGRRVGMYLFDSTAANLTREGWTLFDAAVSWATSAP
jgi:hypothetical protein